MQRIEARSDNLGSIMKPQIEKIHLKDAAFHGSFIGSAIGLTGWIFSGQSEPLLSAPVSIGILSVSVPIFLISFLYSLRD